jgi:murein DD-endopeptidase MepM/ murein hydrolase activator NlpD
LTPHRWSYRATRPLENRPARRPRLRRRWRWGTVLVLACVAVLLVRITARVEAAATSPYPVAHGVPYHPLLAAMNRAADRVDVDGEGVPVELNFRQGQTLSDVLALLELDPREALNVVDELAKHADLRRIRPRDSYAAIYDPAAGLQSFELTLDGKGRAAVRRQGDAWVGSWREFSRRVEVRRLSGRLDDSLEGAIRAAGGEPSLAYRMADVLQWDLDFTRDLRTGDTFQVLYEAVYLDGDYHSLGEVVGLSYDNQGKRLEAYRHGEGDGRGYYDADGRPLQKMFLRSPLRYSRITSRFSGHRFHPVLKRYRPHYGVDYGAPVGTAVRVTAGGVVVSAGWNGGGGRTVKVRHPNGFETSYLHLSKFAASIRAGRRVSQGEVIGYVGSSGLATGPHLDYRVQQNGHWIDPLSLKSVPAEPIPRDDMPQFLADRDRLRRSLWQGEPYEAPASGGDEAFTVAASAPAERLSGG